MSFINSPVFNRVIVPLSFFSSAFGAILLIKESRGGKQCPSKERLDGKVVVVTGGSSGIGKETAKEVAKRGATVVLGCRHMGRCEKAAKEIRITAKSQHVVCRFLDLASLDSVTNFAKIINQELPHIDVLINNAGIMKPRPPKATPLTEDGFERQLETNYLGHFLLTNLLMDNLTNGEQPGRIINVTSAAYERGSLDLEDVEKSSLEGEEKLTELYYQSKLANVLFTDALSRKEELKNRITCNCLNPGVVHTNIDRYSTIPLYALSVYLYKPFQWFIMKTPLQGAQTSLYLSTEPTLSKTTGSYFDDCEFVSKTSEICDCELADKLWEASKIWTRLNERHTSVSHEPQERKS
ncbi:retinol dehydrogenase 13-like [Ciona intestinalis]